MFQSFIACSILLLVLLRPVRADDMSKPSSHHAGGSTNTPRSDAPQGDSKKQFPATLDSASIDSYMEESAKGQQYLLPGKFSSLIENRNKKEEESRRAMVGKIQDLMKSSIKDPQAARKKAMEGYKLFDELDRMWNKSLSSKLKALDTKDRQTFVDGINSLHNIKTEAEYAIALRSIFETMQQNNIPPRLIFGDNGGMLGFPFRESNASNWTKTYSKVLKAVE